MLVDVLAILAGCALLYFGAEWLVGGSSRLARALGVRPLVIGLTVVAYGTSMPEAVVSAVASYGGSPALALGNAIGSNIVNLGLILGVTALLSPPRVEGTMVLREVPVLVASALVPPAMLLDGAIGRIDGVFLLGGAVAFTAWTVKTARGSDVEPPDGAGGASRAKLVALAVAGLLALLTGGRVFVAGAVGIAEGLGIPERIIGLTVVAVGTSLPELAASVVAAMKKESALAVGNVVGSNIFNSFLILGLAAVIRPLDVSLVEMRTDVVVLVLITLAAAVMLRGDRVVTRAEGAVLIASYAGFLAALSAAA